MTIIKTRNLLMKISKTHPYRGELSKEDQLIAAISTAKLFREFAGNGQTNEAMDLPVEHWDEVIKLLNK